MLSIYIPPQEIFNEETMTFEEFKGAKLQLEHSLVSVSKWEANWKKPFMADTKKTKQEIKDYIRCMTITQNVDPRAYDLLDKDTLKTINDYIHDPRTATTFKTIPGASKSRKTSEIQTSELIYYYMIACEIPFECQKWHLNRLLTLIHICSIKNDPKGQKKMSKRDIYSQNKALNAARRAKYGTKG